jgi:copper chaperone CopZ
MIKVIVTNMSCGHCQLKINAELEANNYKVIKIDMDKNSVLIDTSSNQVNRIIRILDSINYLVDVQNPILDIGEHTIWDDKLDNESNYEIFSAYLLNKEIDIVGFNEKDFGVIILCTETQLNEAVEYINEL